MKVLIIENNCEIARKYKDALSSIGCQAKLVGSAIEGLKILSEENFNLILLNIMLPDMHGLSLIKKLRNDNPDFDTPFVLLADIADENMIKEAYDLQASGYLIKSQNSPEQIADFTKTSLFLSK